MPERFRTPYVPTQQYQRGSLGDLIARRGDIEAQGAMASGGAWANAISQVGNIAAGAFQEYGAQKEHKAALQAKELAERPAREMAATKSRLEMEKMQREANAAVQADSQKTASATAATEAKKSPSRMKAFELVSNDPVALKEVEDYFTRKDTAKALEFGDAAAMIRRFGDTDQAVDIALENFLEDGYDPAMVQQIGQQLKDPAKRGMILDSYLKESPNKGHNALVSKSSDAAKPGTFESYVVGKFGPTGGTPEQQLLARNEWEAANDRPADPVAQELGRIRIGEARERAAFAAETAKALEAVPAERRAAIDRVTNSMPDKRAKSWKATLSDAAASGNEEEFKSQIKQAAIESEPVEIRKQVTGRDEMVGLLSEAKTILKDMKARGVPTNFFSGNVEDFLRKVGTTLNPEYVALGNRLAETLINYRRSATGAAFSDKESVAYEKMFPNYRNTLPVNEALIDGLIGAASTNSRTYWSRKVGNQNADWILGASSSGEKSQPSSKPNPFRTKK